MRRVALVALAVAAGVVGAWATFAPASFYADFVFGRGWVRLDGPYNEHLIRDVGALNLGLACVTIVAAIRMEPAFVRVAAAATLVFAVPHLAYHAGAMEPFTPGDVIAQAVALVLQVVVPAWLLVTPTASSERSAARPERSADRAAPDGSRPRTVGPLAIADAREASRLATPTPEMPPRANAELLRVDAVLLAAVGTVQVTLELLGYFGYGPHARIFHGQSFTIGFVEAHALAVLLAIVVYRASHADRLAHGHLLAAGTHLLLGGANLLFWDAFHVYELVGAGVAATTYHGLFAVLQIVALARDRRVRDAEPRRGRTY